jgi:cobalt-zinc-cadmium efflux system protein
LALIFSWIAVLLSQRKPTLKFTYGFRRSTILIALLNTLFLLVAVVFIVIETVERLSKPAEVNAQSVIIVAAVGIVINGFTAWLFMKDKRHDLNIRSAFVHFLADTLVSAGVVIAGIAMAITDLPWLDSVISFIIVAVILYSLYHLLIDTLNLALDAVPENIDIQNVRQYFENLSEVNDVHDLHIWALSTTEAALTVHLATNIQTDASFIASIQHRLHEQFHIEHTTIQVEYGDHIDCDVRC